MEQQTESRSKFLIRNFIKGFIWLLIIVVLFLLTEDFIQRNFQNRIDLIKENPFVMYSIFFSSEVIFGIIPPVLFMTTWKMLLHVSLSEYIMDLIILTLLSFIAGITGFYIGKFSSRTFLYRRFEDRYLKQYNTVLSRYGVFLVIVGALTPPPILRHLHARRICAYAASIFYPGLLNPGILFSYLRMGSMVLSGTVCIKFF
jgi:hypothetical protein